MKKTLITMIALSVIAATPSIAGQTGKRTNVSRQGYNAYAQFIPYRSPPVIYNGKVIGRDPDVSIRAQLLRDPIANEY